MLTLGKKKAVKKARKKKEISPRQTEGNTL